MPKLVLIMSLRFDCLYSHDFVRLASCVPRIEVADPAFNFAETLRLAASGDAAKATVMVFPELGLSAYSIDDLLFFTERAASRLIFLRSGGGCDRYSITFRHYVYSCPTLLN